ncbi:MAG: sigma-70 family RNA polymerase sigma factor [Candidatus Eremiobacteraeota bacterium]|nr:sigma-70 family RNA polymerase sigma factor [Candidatus Eremiobacteraeota bacterium]MBV9700603.1 sigma-70 family RNA polymerase sigma factor [Candidatus Eremiobacteraeota bacterium]
MTLCWPATPLQRDSLVAHYWYLCRRAARRFMRRGLDRGDLEQIAAIGLLKAIDRYDPSEPAPFEAYAWLMILGELMHWVRDGERLLRAPRAIRELERRWSRAERRVCMTLEHGPTEEEVARQIGATPDQIKEVRAFRASNRVLSFELLNEQDPRISPYDIDDVLDRLTVERILAGLSPLEQRIVRAIHLDGVTVVELAARLGYSRRHMTRLHRCALERLKRTCGARAAGVK